MKYLMLLISAFALNFGNAQVDLYGGSGITVSVSETKEITPDYYTVILTLKETVTTDEETQLQKLLKMDEIINKTDEKLKAVGLSKDDLVLYNISEQPYSEDGNMYNYNYNQKQSKTKLIVKEFELKWEKGFDELEKFLKTMRFEGFDGSRIDPEYKEESITAAQEEILKKAVEKAKDKAQILASAAGVKLGDVTNILNNDGYYYGDNYNYNYNTLNYNYNYNNNSMSVMTKNIKSKEEVVNLTVTFSIAP